MLYPLIAAFVVWILSSLYVSSVLSTLLVLSSIPLTHALQRRIARLRVGSLGAQELSSCAHFDQFLSGEKTVSSRHDAECARDTVELLLGNSKLSSRLRMAKKCPGAAAFAFKSSSAAKFLSSSALALNNWQVHCIDQEQAAIEKRTSREELKLIESHIRSRALVEQVASLFDSPFEEFMPRQLAEWRDAIVRVDEGWAQPLLAELNAAHAPIAGSLCGFTLENDRYISREQPLWVRWLHTKLHGSDVTHLALVRRTDAGEPVLSHLWGRPLSKFVVEPFTIGTYGNAIYRANAGAFVNMSHAEAIAVAYPDQPSWKHACQAVFVDALEEWHAAHANFLPRIRNDAAYRLLVALVVNVFSPVSISWRERAQFRDDYIKPAHQNSCSEFVLKVWLQALDLAGAKIAQRLNETRPPNSAEPPLTSEDIIATSVISGRRRIQRYSPAYLIYRCTKRGLMDFMPEPPLFTKLIY
jgi:hypothetical protein